MVRPILALDRLLFLEREGKVGDRWGRQATELETMDYLEFIARVTSHIPDKARSWSAITGSTPTPKFIRRRELTFVAAKPPPAHVFEQVALMAALMEAMRTARLPLRPVLMETCKRHHECSRGERGVRIEA
jgi:hypothetical protein